MTTQDDLAALFQRNLSLQTPTYVASKQEPVVEQPITYSISQHYHHSTHIAAQPSRPASEPPQTDQLTVEIILGRHGVDMNSLFPSQIALFKLADASQQMRLIELWRICPPDYNKQDLANFDNWPGTSFQQEEAMAKLRYERQMLDERMSRTGGDQHSMGSAEDAMSDASTTAPLTPIQAGDGRWQTQAHGAEPYMQSGYESLAAREYEQSARPSKDIYSHFGTAVGGPNYNKATDPVYKTIEDVHKFPNVGGDWEALMQQRQVAMENQYGAFDQQFHHNQGGVTVAGYNSEDEEML
ncbi:hypothetical protein EG329_011505 [Mollisiaceae sp. DMI_Dod_QoI]|nr:hypothetical protein EG329_011505 [Helotiales sp. DMI_Dod_QoI]